MGSSSSSTETEDSDKPRLSSRLSIMAGCTKW
jgi:hypothetical protein